MDDDIKRNLRRLGTYAAADRADRALRRSCIGRIVSLLTLGFILACVASYGLGGLALHQAGLTDQLPDAFGSAVTVSFFIGLIVCIVIAGLVGNWLRRLVWRALLRRR